MAAKKPTSYSLSAEHKEKLKRLSKLERRSMAGELEFLIDKRCEEKNITLPEGWEPPVEEPKE